MISKIVEEQLKKCVFAKLDNFNAETNTYYIPKYSKPKYNINHCYLIKVAKQLINNTESITATNWNNGNAPSNEYYKAYVSKTIGTFIYCDCLAYDIAANTDLNTMYSGWFCIDDLTQIAELQ